MPHCDWQVRSAPAHATKGSSTHDAAKCHSNKAAALIAAQTSTGYVSTVLRLGSGFAPLSGNPHWLCFESAMVRYGIQLAL